jgi:hypothetical protein
VSWRGSLLGALVVVIAGVVVGAAVGGKTDTQELTTTVVKTVKVIKKAPTTSSAGVTTTGRKVATASGPPSGPSQQASQEIYLADYLEQQGGPATLNRTAEDVSLLENPDQQELAGLTYQHAVAFQINGQSESLRDSYQIPTPGFSHLSSAAAGLQTTSNAKTTYQLTVYKNDDNSPNSVVLYEGSFRGPSTIRHLSFALQGATDVLFVWTHKTDEPDSEDTFILADPAVTRQ